MSSPDPILHRPGGLANSSATTQPAIFMTDPSEHVSPCHASPATTSIRPTATAQPGPPSTSASHVLPRQPLPLPYESDVYDGIISLPPSPRLKRTMPDGMPSEEPISPATSEFLDEKSLQLQLETECHGGCLDQCRCSSTDETSDSTVEPKESQANSSFNPRRASLSVSSFGPPRFFSELERHIHTPIVQGPLYRHHSLKQARNRSRTEQRSKSISTIPTQDLDLGAEVEGLTQPFAPEEHHSGRSPRLDRPTPLRDLNRPRASTWWDGFGRFADASAFEEIGQRLMHCDELPCTSNSPNVDGAQSFDSAFDSACDVSRRASVSSDPVLVSTPTEPFSCQDDQGDLSSSRPSTPESNHAVLELAASDSIGGLGKVKMLDLRLHDPVDNMNLASS